LALRVATRKFTSLKDCA